MGLESRLTNSFFEHQNLNKIKQGLDSGKVLNTSLELEKKTSKSTLIALSILTFGIYYLAHKLTHDKARVFKKIESRFNKEANTYIKSLEKPTQRTKPSSETLEETLETMNTELERANLKEGLRRMEAKNGAEPFRFSNAFPGTEDLEALRMVAASHPLHLPLIIEKINQKLEEPNLDLTLKNHLLRAKLDAEQGKLHAVPYSVSTDKFEWGIPFPDINLTSPDTLVSLEPQTITLTNQEVLEKMRSRLQELPPPSLERFQSNPIRLTEDRQVINQVVNSISSIADSLWPSDTAAKLSANKTLAGLKQQIIDSEARVLAKRPMTIDDF